MGEAEVTPGEAWIVWPVVGVLAFLMIVLLFGHRG